MSEFLKAWWPIIIYFILVIFGFGVMFFENETNTVYKILTALDTASAIALAVLAGIAYYQYSKEKSKHQKYLKDIEKSKNTIGNDGAVLISFGGKKNVLNDMKNFVKNNLKIEEDLIIEKRFGDENGIVKEEDLARLEDFLENEVMNRLTYVDNIHLLYGVVGIGAYVCADVLSNWKNIYVYHYNNNYELWYTDRKHRKKIDADLHQTNL